MNNEELKSCAHCGSKAELYEFNDCDDSRDSYCVECTICGINTLNYYSKQQAIEAWNQRIL